MIEILGYVTVAAFTIAFCAAVMISVIYVLGLDVVARAWWSRIRPFFYLTPEDYLMEERVYTIFPSGHESYGVRYHTILCGRKSKVATLLETVGSEEEAQQAITKNIRLCAIAKAESFVQLIRTKKAKPYVWPDDAERHHDTQLIFQKHCDYLLNKEQIRG